MGNLFYTKMIRFYFRTFDILDSVPVTAVRAISFFLLTCIRL